MNFELTEISTQQRSTLQKNYDVKKGESYFDTDGKEIFIKTPVANNNFNVRNVFFLTDREPLVIVHITDDTEIERKEEVSQFFLEVDLNFSDLIVVGRKPFNLHPADHLKVVVFNDDTVITAFNLLEETEVISGFGFNLPNTINPDNGRILVEEARKYISIKAYFDGGYFKPKESGGGVIIEGP